MASLIQDDLNFQGLAHLIRALLNPLTATPSTPGTGEFWFRTDTKQVSYYDGSAVRVIADLDQVVNTFASGDSTITTGGTATARTAAVAKTLDHTYITDFVATVDAQPLSSLAVPVATVNFNSQVLTGIANATNPTDALNLQTAQTLLAQISDRAEVRYASTTPLAANTYANGTNGSGATLTGSANGALVMDGQNPPVGERVLAAGEATSANNGIYTVTATGSASAAYILTRAADFNVAANISTGVLIPVNAASNETAGTNNNAKVFISVAPSPVVVGTSTLTFTAVGSTYTAGTGLTLTGTQFSLTIPIAVSSGGTGATTAAGARAVTALGAPATAPSGGGTGGVVSATAQGIPTKVYFVVGDGTTLSFTLAHNLGTTLVAVVAGPHNGGSNNYLMVPNPVDANHITVTFLVAPAASGVDVAVFG